jgi:hypothetical protein
MRKGEGKEFQGGSLQAGSVFRRESFSNFIGRRPVESMGFKKRVHTEEDAREGVCFRNNSVF